MAYKVISIDDWKMLDSKRQKCVEQRSRNSDGSALMEQKLGGMFYLLTIWEDLYVVLSTQI